MLTRNLASHFAKELGLPRWYTIAPDYVYGRDSVRDWMKQLMKRNPQVQIVGQGWPKLFESDYTPYITQVANAKPDAGICVTFAGDTISFVKQGVMYGIFEKTKFFFVDLAFAVQPIVKVQGKFVGGLHSRLGYSRSFPDTKANHDFCDSYTKRFGFALNEYVWRGYTPGLLLEGAVKKAGSTDAEKVVRAPGRSDCGRSHRRGPRGHSDNARQGPPVDQLCRRLGGLYPPGALFHQRIYAAV